MGIWNPTVGAGLNLVADGDSQTAMAGNWFGRVLAYAGNATARGYNHAVSGKTAVQCAASYSVGGVTPAYEVGGGRQYSPARTGRRGIYFLYAGINDLQQGIAGSVAFAALSATWAAARADGYEKVVAFTIPPWNGLSTAAEADRVSLNAAIRASAGYDVLVDLDRLLPNMWAEAFDEGHHLTPTGQAIVAKQVWALVGGGEPYRHFVLAQLVNGDFLTSPAVKRVQNWGALRDVAGLLQGDAVHCPVEGVVRVEVKLLHSAVSPTDVWKLEVAKNGASAKLLSYEPAGSAYRMQGGVAEVVVSAGDVLEVRVECATQAGTSTLHTYENSHWSVEYLPAGGA